MVALSVPTDRGWLALSIPCRALGTGPRPSTRRALGTGPRPSTRRALGTGPRPSTRRALGTGPRPSTRRALGTGPRPSTRRALGTGPRPSTRRALGTGPRPSTRRALGTGPRPSTRGTHKIGLTGYTDAEYIFHLNGPNYTKYTEPNVTNLCSLLQPGECWQRKTNRLLFGLILVNMSIN